MKVTPTAIPDVVMFEPDVFGDERGFFLESWNERKFRDAAGIDVRFVQDNHSRSRRGVLRGLHYQIKQPQGKLVRVVRGRVFDVAVDLRKSSPTFGRWVGTDLAEDNHRQLWIPSGFAHGFLVLSESRELPLQVHGLLCGGARTLHLVERSRDRDRVADGPRTDALGQGSSRRVTPRG